MFVNMINLNGYEWMVCVHCGLPEEARELMERLKAAGYHRMYTGDIPDPENTGWEKYGSDTCYVLDPERRTVECGDYSAKIRTAEFSELIFPGTDGKEKTDGEARFGALKACAMSETSLLDFLAWTKRYNTSRYWQMLFGLDSLAEVQEKHSVTEMLSAVFAGGTGADAYERSFADAVTLYTEKRVAELEAAYAVFRKVTEDPQWQKKQNRFAEVREMFGGNGGFCRAVAENAIAVWNDGKDREGNVSFAIAYTLDSPKTALDAYRSRKGLGL